MSGDHAADRAATLLFVRRALESAPRYGTRAMIEVADLEDLRDRLDPPVPAVTREPQSASAGP